MCHRISFCGSKDNVLAHRLCSTKHTNIFICCISRHYHWHGIELHGKSIKQATNSVEKDHNTITGSFTQDSWCSKHVTNEANLEYKSKKFKLQPSCSDE